MHLGAADRALHSNERLEFLGDALLGFVVGDYLYNHFDGHDEGFLTRMRAKLVNGKSLAAQAERLELGRYIELSANAEKSLGRSSRGILADAYEALIGAVYLDLGLEEARSFVHRTLLADRDLEALARKRDNYKSLLLETVQGRGWGQPVYEVLSSEGPDHRKTFTVGVFVRSRQVGSGSAPNKKSAEQQAAREALERLSVDDDREVSEL
jgi:ribonuclease-3